MIRPNAPRNVNASRPDRYLGLGLERLEDRRLLAGNVTVVQTAAGDIRISGDDSSNRIAVKSDTNGDLLVQGVSSTTVNGNSSATIQLATDSTIDRNLIVNMRGGGDTVQIVNVNVNGRTKVNMGSGPVNNLTIVAGTFGDRVELRSTSEVNDLFFQSATVHGDVSIRTGRGADNVKVTGAFLAGDVSVTLGGNNDELLTENVDITGNMLVTGGGGQDLMDFRNATIQGNAVLRSGSGGDAIGIIGSTASEWRANTAAGEDLFVFLHATGDMNVNMGSGSDIVWGACSTIGTSTWKLGSGEVDFALFANDFVSDTSVIGGGGVDAVVFIGATFGGPLSVSLGSGIDSFGINNSTTIAAGATIHGNGGDDGLFVPPGFMVPSDVEFVSIEQETVFPNSLFDEAEMNLEMRAKLLWLDYGGDPTVLVC